MLEGPSGPFSLRLPAEPQHAATARLFIASLARSLGFDEATVEDLKLAVSEAVAGAVIAGSPVHIDAHIEGDRFIVAVGPVERGAISADRFDVFSIISALFDGASFENEQIVIPVTSGR